MIGREINHIIFKCRRFRLKVVGPLFKRIGQPRPLFHLFSFSQTHSTNFTTNEKNVIPAWIELTTFGT